MIEFLMEHKTFSATTGAESTSMIMTTAGVDSRRPRRASRNVKLTSFAMSATDRIAFRIPSNPKTFMISSLVAPVMTNVIDIFCLVVVNVVDAVVNVCDVVGVNVVVSNVVSVDGR